MASDVLGCSRLIFAFARDGRLPAWFGGLSARTRVPARAVVLYAGVASVLAITGSFMELVVLSALGVVAIYALACASAWVLQSRGVALAGPPLRMRALPVAAGVGLLGMGAMLAAARPVEIAGLAGAVGLSLVAYRLTRAAG